MSEMDFFYERIEHNILLDLLKNNDISSALAYMIDFTNHYKFSVEPKKHCIEISNENITIAVIFFVGFEIEEYQLLQYQENLHLVSFCSVLPTMHEFKDLNIKIINNISLLFTVLSRSEDFYGQTLNNLKNLKD